MLTYHFPPCSALSLVVKDGFTYSLPWRGCLSCPTPLMLIGMAARCRYELATMWNEQGTASLLVDAVDRRSNQLYMYMEMMNPPNHTELSVRTHSRR
jgi:hypothetical protein